MGVLACLVTAVAAIAGTSQALTVGLAALAALCVLALGAASGRRHRDLRGVAAWIQHAPDLAAMEAAARAEIESWPDVRLHWCVIVPAVGDGRRRLPPAIRADVEEATAGLGNGDDLTPVRIRFADHDVVAAPCTAGLSHVLIIGGPRLPAGIGRSLSDLAALVGVAVHQFELGAELEVRRDAARFEKVVQYASDATFVVTADGTIDYAASSVTTILGYRSVDVVGWHVTDLLVDGQAPAAETFLLHVATQDARHPATIQLDFRRADGTTMAGEVTGANLLRDPDVGGMIVTVRDVSARIDLERQLRHQAFHDNLTGLANRALFRDRLDHRMDARRDPNSNAPAVIFIDLDDFKDVNDSYGHAAGDALLQTVAQRIESCLRVGDTAARLGGDEFAVLLDDVGETEILDHLARRVIDALSQRFAFGDHVIEVQASAGGALASPDVQTSEDLLRHADQAMYRAKLQGKGQVVHYDAGGWDRMVAEAPQDEIDLVGDAALERLEPH